MAKSRRTKKQLVAVHVVGCYFSDLKSVIDRFRGTARELGREGLPKVRHQEYLQTLGRLICDFSDVFRAEYFDAPNLPKSWRQLRNVALDCQQQLIEQFRQLGKLDPLDEVAEYDLRYKTASAVLEPFAEQLRHAVHAT